MYPWFPHYPGYRQAMPPPPPPPSPAVSSLTFGEAGANAARQHHVYLHGTDHFGRGRFYRRGPSRLKWFLLGGLAAFLYLRHRRHQQLQYNDEDGVDPRSYFFACRRRREDLMPLAPSNAIAKNDTRSPTSPVHRGTEQGPHGSDWHERWNNRWRGQQPAEKTVIPAVSMGDQPESTSVAPSGRTSSNENFRPVLSAEVPAKNDVNTDSKPTELLTFDNSVFDHGAASTDSTARERMEAEAMAFAEDKIDALVKLLEGLKKKLHSKKE